ncbi:hypothetical protein Trydic_g20470 [Trypoxylus dichotomus]
MATEVSGNRFNNGQSSNGATKDVQNRRKQKSVCQLVHGSPGLLVRKRINVLNLPKSTIRRILRKDLRLHPHKLQIVQELKPTDAVNVLFNCFVVVFRF